MTRPPIGREADVTGYDEMVRRIEQLWRYGWHSDEAMAEQLSADVRAKLGPSYKRRGAPEGNLNRQKKAHGKKRSTKRR